MGQSDWIQISGLESPETPAIAGHSDDCLHMAAVKPDGEVVTSRIETLDDGWTSFETVKSLPGVAQMSAATDTPLVLHRRQDKLYLFCRGTDNNLHVSWRDTHGGWVRWRVLDCGGRVGGRFSVAMTESPLNVHVLHNGAGNSVEYRRFAGVNRPDGTPTVWSNVREAEIGSDGDSVIVAALRTTDDRLVLRRMHLARNKVWHPVVDEYGTETPRTCLGLSNVAHHGDAFHVVYASKTVWDDVSGTFLYFLGHARVWRFFDDDHYFRNVYSYVPQSGRHPQATLVTYRNRLVIGISDENSKIRYGWLDDFDPESPWIGLDVVTSGRAVQRPALAEVDFRAGFLREGNPLGREGLWSPNLGNDLFAAVRGVTGTGVYFVNFSRSFLALHLQALEHSADWCTNYSGSKTMASCTSKPDLPSVEELPVFTECGFGAMTLPFWLIRDMFPCVMRNEGLSNDPYMVWIHTDDMPTAYIGPHINVDAAMSFSDWHHEMLHRFATNIAMIDHKQKPANKNLMLDLFPDQLVNEAEALFGDHVDTKWVEDAIVTCLLGKDGSRCIGFVNDGNTNYDATTCQHSLIGVIEKYVWEAFKLRGYAYSDLRAGHDLLWRKYRWVREHIFRGIEFGDPFTPVHPASIVNSHSGKALDVTAWGLADNDPIQQYTSHAGDNQRWLLVPKKGGYVQIMAMHSGKCLDVTGLSQDNGARIQQFRASGGANQQWTIEPSGNGTYEIVARHSGKCLEVAGWSTRDGGHIAQYGRHGGDNQKWVIRV